MAKVSLVFILLAQLSSPGDTLKIGVLIDRQHGQGLQRVVTEALRCFPAPRMKGGPSNDNDLIWRTVNRTNFLQLSEEVCSIAEDGIDGLISVLDPRSQVFVSGQLDSFHLPHLIVCAHQCDCPMTHRYSRYASPSHKEKIDLLAETITYLGWDNFGFIYDESVGDSEKRNLLFAISLKESAATITLINSTSQKWVILRKLGQLKGRASELKMAGPEYQWFIFDERYFRLNTSDLTENHTLSHLLVASRVTSVWPAQHCGQQLQINNNNNNIYSAIVAGVLEATLIFSNLGAINKTVNTNVCFGQNTMTTNKSFSVNQYQLKDVRGGLFQNFTPAGHPASRGFDLHSRSYVADREMISVGRWRHATGLTVHSQLGLFVNKFRDFHGKVIKVTAKEEKPFVIRQRNGSSWHYTGLAFDILDGLADALNFRYEVVEPEDRRYGAPNEDGTWNGMVGMVKRQKVVMAIGPFSITALRDRAIDYTKPYMDDSITILTRKTQKSANLFQMMRPFSTEVWVCIVCVVLLGGLLLTITNRYTPYGTKYPPDDGFITDEHAFLENLWVVYASVMEQGAVYIPAANSSRCILGFMWIFTILIISTYTANLAAFLTVADPPPSINTLAQLLQQDDLDILVQDGSNLWSLFKDSDHDLYQEMWKRLQNSPKVDGLDAALPHVRTGKYAYVGDTSTLEYVAAQECHSFVVAGESFNAGTYGLIMPEDTPFKEAMDYYIMKMLEAGFIDNWRQKWWARADDCLDGSRTRASALSLDTLGGVFLVYCASALCATVLLIVSVSMKSTSRPNCISTETKDTETKDTETTETKDTETKDTEPEHVSKNNNTKTLTD